MLIAKALARAREEENKRAPPLESLRFFFQRNNGMRNNHDEEAFKIFQNF